MSAHASEKAPGWFHRHQVKLLKWSVVAAFVAVVAGGFYVSYSIFRISNRTEQQDVTIAALAKNLDSSRDQLKDNGITPSAPPAKQVVEEVKGQPGAQGEPGSTGPQGVSGPSGPPGPSGSPGPRGVQGPKGDTGNNGSEGVPGSAGQTGPSGAPGTNGADGVNGNDGTPGQDGVNGNDGAPGANGQDGAQGPQGEQGPPGPQGEKGDKGDPGTQGTLPATMTINHGDGTTETCTLQGDSTYNCAGPAPDPTPTDEPTGEAAAYRHEQNDSPGNQPVTMSQVYAIVAERKRFV